MKNVLACRLLPLFLLALFLPRPAHSVGNEKGLWREALFRWERASKLLPDNARILNNLAVAYETAGEFEKAQAMYTEALRLAPDNRDIRQNHTLFEAYYKDLLARKEHDASPPPTPDSGKEPEKEPPDAPPH